SQSGPGRLQTSTSNHHKRKTVTRRGIRPCGKRDLSHRAVVVIEGPNIVVRATNGARVVNSRGASVVDSESQLVQRVRLVVHNKWVVGTDVIGGINASVEFIIATSNINDVSTGNNRPNDSQGTLSVSGTAVVLQQ